MSDIAVYNCICQNCNKMFPVNSYMTNVLDMDSEDEKLCSFLSGTLNNTTCPHCSSSFTYEIPMLVYSMKKKYAIKVSPAQNEKDFTEQRPPHFLFPYEFKYREVSFQIEAVEKARIFDAGLDDKIIEYIKFTSFGDEDALPFDEVNIIFDHKNNDDYHFVKINSDNQILNKYCISSPPLTDCVFSSEARSDKKWAVINRFTIINYTKEEK